MSKPESKVEIGFDLSESEFANTFRLDDATRGVLDNTTYVLAGVLFYDVTDKVKSIAIQRGKNRQLDQYDQGLANIVFNNNDRTFDPEYALSPFAGQIVPKREVRISANQVIYPETDTINLMTNPSFEGQSTTTTTNLITNPSFETDTSGWVTSGGTLTRITTDSVFGTACANFAATASGNLFLFDATATPSTTYNFSVYVKGESGKTFNITLQERTASTSVGSTTSSTITGNGQWQRVSVSRAFGATGVVARCWINNTTSGAHTLLADGALLTVGATTETYFDGSTTGVNDTTFAWTGTANASTSTRACNTLTTVRTNLFTNPSIELATTGYAGARTTLSLDDTFVFTGNRSLRGTISSALSGQYIDGTQTSIVASTSYTFSCYVYLPATNTADSDFRLQFHPWTGSAYLSAISGTIVTIPRGVWTRLSVTGTMPSNATQVLPRLLSTTTLAVGQVYITDGWLLEQSSALGDYFDGNTTASGDYIYRWNGVVSNSSSTQQVRQVTASPTGTNSAAGMSRVWDSTGLRSLVVAPTGANNDSHVRFSFSGLTSGATYTALVTCYLSAPLTGTLNSRTRQISAWNSTFITNAGSATAPNTAGSHTLRFTFTANDTTMILALHNGASVNNGLVWFDDLLLVAGNYQDEYFDGGTTSTDPLLSYAWSGTVNASTSVRTSALHITGINFTGLIDDWNLSYEPNGDSIASAACSDATSAFATQTIGTRTNSVQKSGERINAILSLPEIDWPTTLRDVDTGQMTLGADTIPDNTNALTYFRLIEQSEPGSFFIGKSGNVVFRDRNATPTTGGVVLADDGTGIPYQSIKVQYGSELLANEVVIESGITSYQAVAIDNASISDYGIFNLTRTGLLINSNTDVDNLAIFYANKYAQPEYRFESVDILLDELSNTQQDQLIGLELGDVVSIKFTPNGIAPAIEKFAEVIRIDHAVDLENHVMSLGFATLDFSLLVLDDQQFGKLDSGNALAF